MNKVILMGRLTRDPEVRYSQNDTSMAIARYSLAVDRRFSRNNNNGDQQTVDFINCVAFGRSAEFAEKYFRQGMRVTISGRIQTGSYTNNEGNRVYTTEVVVEEQEFAESKSASQANAAAYQPQQYSAPAPMQSAPRPAADGFMNIPEGLEEELPFS